MGKTKIKLTSKQKAIIEAIFIASGLFIGNRIFNHVSAWADIAVICVTLLASIYLIYKHIKKTYEKND